MEIKRVVTAVDERGRSVVQEERTVEPIRPDLFAVFSLYGIWGTEGPIAHPGALGDVAAVPTFFPGPGGTRFGVFELAPQPRDAPPPPTLDEATMTALLADAEAKVPGALAHFEPDAPGFHTTPTVDYDVVLRGTVTLELDDGVEVQLPAGSCVVQRGTRHAWHNYGSEPALVAFVVLDTRRGG